MGLIKTNYSRDSKLVMIDEEKNVVAIINVPKGANITDNVMLAIKDQLMANQVVFENDIEIEEFEYYKKIPFIYSDADDDKFSTSYEVIKTEEY